VAETRKTLTPRQKERRARILKTARELINEAGYEGMTTRELAARASVSPTTLFNLYNTKEELLLAALREQLTSMNGEMEQATREVGLERLLSVQDIIADQLDRTPAYARAIVGTLIRSAPGEPMVRILLGGFFDQIRECLEVMAEKRQLKDSIDTSDLGRTLLGAFWGVQLLWDKAVIDAKDTRRASRISFLSILITATRGKTRKQLEAELDELR
jgi:AcrR family transcriptional regulator